MEQAIHVTHLHICCSFPEYQKQNWLKKKENNGDDFATIPNYVTELSQWGARHQWVLSRFGNLELLEGGFNSFVTNDFALPQMSFCGQLLYPYIILKNYLEDALTISLGNDIVWNTSIHGILDYRKNATHPKRNEEKQKK